MAVKVPVSGANWSAAAVSAIAAVTGAEVNTGASFVPVIPNVTDVLAVSALSLSSAVTTKLSWTLCPAARPLVAASALSSA